MWELYQRLAKIFPMESYSRGPHFDLTTKTTHQVFLDTAARFPDRDALIVSHQDVRLTWTQLAAEVDRTARGLIGLGLTRGDRVGVWATNCAEWVYLQLGCARAGLVQVNVNPAYRAHELAYVLKKSGMKALILQAQDARSNYRQILEEAMRGQNLPLRHTIYLDDATWDRCSKTASTSATARRLSRRRQHSIHLRHHRLARRESCSRITTS